MIMIRQCGRNQNHRDKHLHDQYDRLQIYEYIAIYLVNWEMPRTQSDYEQSFTFKMFAFQVNIIILDDSQNEDDDKLDMTLVITTTLVK